MCFRMIIGCLSFPFFLYLKHDNHHYYHNHLFGYYLVCANPYALCVTLDQLYGVVTIIFGGPQIGGYQSMLQTVFLQLMAFTSL